MEELLSVLWSYRITPRESTDMAPFQLVYGGEVVMPMEIEMESIWVKTYDEEDNVHKRQMELYLVIET